MNYCFFAVNSVSDVFLLIGLAIVSPVHDDVLILKKNFSLTYRICQTAE